MWMFYSAIFERQIARKALCRPDVHIILGSLHELHVRAMAGFQKYHCNYSCLFCYNGTIEFNNNNNLHLIIL